MNESTTEDTENEIKEETTSTDHDHEPKDVPAVPEVVPADVEEATDAASSPAEVVEPVEPLTEDPREAEDQATDESDVVQDGVDSDDDSESTTLHSMASDSHDTEAVVEQAPVVNPKKWYIVKVTSNREESIKAAIERKVKIEGLEQFFGQVYIPVERVIEVKKVKETKKDGEKVTKEKRVTKERKKYPGYIMAEVEFNDQILYLFRETSGVGDFVGAAPGKPPAPMNDIDIQRMLGEAVPVGADGKQATPGKTVVKLDFEKGDKVKIRDGSFAGMEGDVKDISTPKDASETPKITVVVSIFGRPVEMEFDHWQVDKN